MRRLREFADSCHLDPSSEADGSEVSRYARMAYCVIQGREQIGIFVERGLQSKLPHLDKLLPENNAHG